MNSSHKPGVVRSGMGRLAEHSVIEIKSKSHSVTTDVLVPDSEAEGVLVARGGMLCAWSLYAKDGKLKYCCNLLGRKTWFVESEEPIPFGAHPVRVEFAYDGSGIGKGGLAALFTAGQKVDSGCGGDTRIGLFSRRGLRCGSGGRIAGVARLRPARQRIQWRGPLGADRPGPGRPKPSG